MQTSHEANQSIQSLQFSPAEAGSTDQRRLGLGLSDNASLSTSLRPSRVEFPTAEVVLRSSSLLDASGHKRDGETQSHHRF